MVVNRYLTASIAMSALIGSAAVAEISLNSPLQAQETFPDVSPDYWATPFIQALAREGIITGYPDGTFRPQQPIDRDEFSAMIRQAFDEEDVREIASASVFNDVPEGYWAETSIEAAYEAGFLNTQGESFNPQEPVTKVSAITALTRGLELMYARPTATTTQTTYTPVAPAQNQRQTAKRSLMFPLASTALMSPFLKTVSTAQAAITDGVETPQASASSPEADSDASLAILSPEATEITGPTASEIVQAYYEDADQIPKDAINNVAIATKEGIVVNYPTPNLLVPNEPISRGEVSALVHQTLVELGELEPLEADLDLSQYIIGPISDEELTAEFGQRQ